MAENLPIEIALDIFSRLLAETVLTCKLVCKTWHNYLSHDGPSFANLHLRQLNRPLDDHKNGAAGSKVRLGFISLSKSEYPLRYGESCEKKCTIQFRKITHPLIRKGNTDLLVGSCNGLICLAESWSNLADPVHICNPINRECLQLPGFDENNDYESVHQVCSGFGYSSRTNEYKVVRILYYDDGDDGTIGHIQVYTLGSGNGWRNKGVITNTFDKTYGVFAYGDLYWVDLNEKKMIVFNLSDEGFKILPTGPFYDPTCDEFSFLRSCGERLYGVEYKEGRTIIWYFFKSRPEGKINRAFVVDREIGNGVGLDAPFAVTENGLIVMWNIQTRFSIYNKKHITKTLYIYNPETKFHTCLGDFDESLEIIPHTNSFVSLKDLGETSCKKRKLFKDTFDESSD